MAFTLSGINFIAVVLAAVANMALGAIWYHPKVFGTKWMELSGRKMEAAGSATQGYIFLSLGSLLGALALAALIVALGFGNWVDGLGLGALVGVGFLLPVLGADFVFSGKPVSLYMFNVTYYIIGYVVMGIILGAMH